VSGLDAERGGRMGYKEMGSRPCNGLRARNEALLKTKEGGVSRGPIWFF